MARQHLCCLGLAQLSVNPAYSDEQATEIQEPTFLKKNGRVGLFTVAGIEEVNGLRLRIADRYVSHLNRKLEAVIRFAAYVGVELLVFPEYSVPPESFPLCRRLCDELGLAILPGSHVLTLRWGAQSAYRELDLPFSEVVAASQPKARERQAGCAIFLPGQKTVTFTKSVRSKWDMAVDSRKALRPLFHCVMVSTKVGQIELQVLNCGQAVSDEPTAKEKHGHPQLIAVPAFTPSVQPFYDFGRESLTHGRCTLFANAAEFGGSKAFVTSDRPHLWFTERDGSRVVPEASEALLVLTADLAAQFENRKSAKEYSAVADVRVYPLLYPSDSKEARQYGELLQGAPPDLAGEDLARAVKPFASVTTQAFPALLRSKLQHFTDQVADPRIIDAAESRPWVQAVIVANTISTGRLRYEFCSEAIAIVNDLQLSGRYATRTNALLDVYSHLVTARNALRPSIDLGVEPQLAPTSPVEAHERGLSRKSPFMDRDKALDRIRAFMNQEYHAVFVLSGMRGIGKSSLVQAAFGQVITPIWRRISLRLTEGTSHLRLLAQLASACDLQLPENLDLSKPDKQAEMERGIISYLSSGPPAVVIFDDFQFLLNPSGEVDDAGVQHLLNSLVQASDKTKTKCFFVSDVAPRLGPEVERRCAPHSLMGLSREDTARLLAYWFEFQHEAAAGQVPSPSERLLSALGGHPLATKVAARLWAEHPSQDISKDMTLFKELRDTIVAFILGKLSLSVAEVDLILFASTLRIPAPRELFIAWNGERANHLLNSLASRYLVESSEEGYQLHPLVRDYYYQGLPVVRAMGLHKVVGKFYYDLFEKEKKSTKRLAPEFLGEAVHHYLAAGDRKKVQGLAFFKNELIPVARSHYQKQDFDTALKEYAILADLDDSDADAHYHLARIHAHYNRWDQAEHHFDKAIRLRPNSCWILQGYAAAKRRAGRLGEAQTLLEKSVSINPGHSPTLVELGRLCEAYNDTGSAEEYYEKAIEADSNNFWAYYRLARLLNHAGSLEAAFQMIKAAVRTNPTHPQARELLAELEKKLEEGSQPGGPDEPSAT